MKLVVYADLHINAVGKHAWPPNDLNAIEQGNHVACVGDIAEMKNIKKKNVKKHTEKLRLFIEKCKANGTSYVVGNHEVQAGKELSGIYHEVKLWNEKKVLLIHGHRLSYSESKSEKWENKKAGGSWWKLKMIAFKNGNYKESKPKKISSEKVANAVAMCREFGCSVIIWGHTHNTADEMHEGYRLINVGRGRTEVDI